MLGITVQGLLFNFGTLTLGRGVVGAMVGAVLLALWGFVQPLVIYYALFGERMLDVGKELAKDAAKILPLEPRHFIIAAVTLVALKALLAIVVTLVARAASPEAVRRYEDRLVKAGAARRGRMLASLDENEDKARAGVPLIAARAAARGALTDLASPLYLVSLALGAAFLVFVESDFVGAIWMAARFFAVGFLVFFALRVLPVERLTLRLEAARSPSVAAFARRLRATLGLLKEM